MTIELRLIRCAPALGRHSNFARAAKALQIAQPSLPRGIASLEPSLGTPHGVLAGRIDPGVTGASGLEAGQYPSQTHVNSVSAARLIARKRNALAPGSAASLADDVAADAAVTLPNPHRRVGARR